MHGMEPAQGTCIADSNACVTAPSKSFEMKVSDIRHRLTVFALMGFGFVLVQYFLSMLPTTPFWNVNEFSVLLFMLEVWNWFS